ncbi:nuclear transport factor 2 family protein [Corallococcus coralloides]|uniref:nuclear transport factor 2 family protein n=1 Tax=Corallococcus coralloides TaxID=184914 RepID=UPI00384A5C65
MLLIATLMTATCRSTTNERARGPHAEAEPKRFGATSEDRTMMIAKDEAHLKEAYRQMIKAMLDRHVAELDALLAGEFTLTHMTGYRQPKREWLEAVRTGQMRYHAAEEKSVDVNVAGDTAVLVGRSVVTATIYGARGTWNLQLTTRYRRQDNRWIAVDTIASTF